MPAKTVPEFIAYAKANPGKINMAAPGMGSPLAVAGELFKMMAGVDMANVPYQGEAPAIPDLISGQSRSCSASCRRRSAISKPASCGRSP